MNGETQTARIVRPPWAEIMKEMLTIDFSMGRPRFATRLKWDKLGLDPAIYKQAFTAGVQRLLPWPVEQELDAIEDLARKLLDRITYRTTLARLIAADTYSEFKAWLTEKPLAELRLWLYGSSVKEWRKGVGDAWAVTPLYERWFDLMEEIAVNRNVIVDQVADACEAAAIDIWRRKNGGGEPPFDLLDTVKAELVSRIPSDTEIRARFTLEWSLGRVEAPPDAVKQVKLEEIEKAQAEVEQKLRNAASAEERANLLVQQARLDRDRMLTEEIARLNGKNRADFERVQTEILQQRAGRLLEVIMAGIAQTQENGKVHHKWLKRAAGTLEELRLLKFGDSLNIDDLAAEIDTLIASNPLGEADAARVENTLARIGNELRAELLALDVPVRAAPEIVFADEPGDLFETVTRRTGDTVDLEDDDTPLMDVERAAPEPLAA